MADNAATATSAAPSRAARMADILTRALAPQLLEVRDDSQQHAGHSGWRLEGETHYEVRVVAQAFAGKSRVERHRLLNDLLAPEFASGLHALSLKALTPDEAAVAGK